MITRGNGPAARGRFRTLAPLLLLLSLAATNAFATAYVSNSGGTWSTPSIWTPNGVPGAADTATISSGHTVLADSALTVGGLTVNSGGTADTSSFGISVVNTLTENGSVAGIGDLSISGNATVAGTGSITPSLHFNSGTTSTIVSGAVLTIGGEIQSDGVVTNNGNVTVSDSSNGVKGSGSFIQGTTGSVSTNGPIAITTFTATASGNLVTYTSTSAQNVRGTTYYDVAFSGSSVKTATGLATVTHNLTVNAGTFSDGGFQLTGNGTGTMQLAAGTTFQMNAPLFPSFGAYTFSPTSTVNYGASSAQTVSAAASPYPTLILSVSTASATKTANGAITANSLQLNQALGTVTFATAGQNITVTQDLLGAGTLDQTGGGFVAVGGNVSWTGSYVPGLGKFLYSGTSQTIRSLSYYDLGMTGAGPYAAGGALIATHSVNTGSGSPAVNLGLFSLQIATGGTGDLSGSGTFNGTGTLSLSGAGNLSGILTINNPVSISGTRAIQSGAGITFTGTIALATSTMVNNAAAVIAATITGTDATSIWKNTGSTKISGSLFPVAGTLDASTSGNTVEYNGSLLQTVYVTTYDNLALSGTAAKTMLGVTTINNDFSILSGSAVTISNPLTIGRNFSSNTTGAVVMGSFTHNIGGGLSAFGTVPNFTGTTLNFNGSVNPQVLNCPSSTLGNLTFNGSSTKTLGSSFTVTGDVTIGAGSNLNGGALGYGVAVGGNWTNSGTFTPGNSTIALTGASKNVSGSAFWNLTISGIITAAGPLTVNNDLIVNVSASLNGGAFAHTVGGSFTQTGVFTPGTSNVIFTGTSAATTNGAFYDLTASRSGTLTLAGIATIQHNLAVTSGQLNLSAFAMSVAGSLTNGSAIDAGTNTLTITGDAVNNGSFAGSTGTVVLNGTGAQNWSGTTAPGFNNLTVTNSAGVMFQKDISVATAMTLSGGNVSVMTGNEILVNGTLARTNGSYIIGKLEIAFSAPGLKTWHVGTFSGYTPVDITVATGGGSIAVTSNDGFQPNLTGSNGLNRYWTLVNNGVTSATLTFSYLGGDAFGTPSLYDVGRYSGTWTRFTPTSHNTGTRVISLAGVTSITGNWTAAETSSLGLATLTSVHPSTANILGGSTIYIDGTSLTGSTVNIGGSAATILSNTATRIVARAPAHVIGLVNVDVTTPGGPLSLPNAVTYNNQWKLARDFSPTSNPNGNWTLGTEASLNGAFTPLTTPGQLGFAEAWGSGPDFAHNPEASSITVSGWTLPLDTVGAHPAAGQYAAARWTAPLTGVYHVNGSFSDMQAATTDVHIYNGATSLFSDSVTVLSSRPFSFDRALPAGATLDFLVGDGGNGAASDGTLLDLNVSPAAGADVAVSTTIPATAIGGQSYNWTVTATNTGSDTAANVTLNTVVLTGGATITGYSASPGWNCGSTSGSVSCSVAALASGFAGTITVAATAPASGTVTYTAVANLDNDPATANNTVNDFTTVTSPTADIALTAGVTPGSGITGTNFDFNLMVTNAGAATATNVTIVAPLPSELTYVSATGATCTGTTTITCNAGTIAAAGSKNVTIRLQAAAPGLPTVTFSSSSDQSDPVPANNSAFQSVTISATSLVVTTNVDSANGSLRNAITAANSPAVCPAPCTITFNLPMGQTTLSLTTDLPIVTASQVTIDGTTQPGYVAGMPVVTLDGNFCGCIDGFAINGTRDTIRGFVIGNFQHGIRIGGSGNKIEGNLIGITAANVSMRNISHGIYISGFGNTIGGTSASQRNVISFNTGPGIDIDGDNTTVQGNYIGTTISGSAAAGNTGDGIAIEDAANNVIGGSGVGAANVISGNTGAGIYILDTNGPLMGLAPMGNAIGARPRPTGSRVRAIRGGGVTTLSNPTGNVIKGNRIGTNAAGTAAVGNQYGIYLDTDASSNTIGGALASDGNVIGGSSLAGIFIGSNSGNQIQGNSIGTLGLTSLPNTTGIKLNGASNQRIVSNDIAHNTGTGIDVTAGLGNVFLNNSIHANGTLGIDLGSDGVTPDDAGDADTGANNLQNRPSIVDAVLTAGMLVTHLNVDSSSVASTQSLLIELYEADSSTNAQGLNRIAFQCVAGNVLAGTPLTIAASPVSAGARLVATATSYGDNGCVTVNDGTSEFSPPITVSTCTPPSTTITPGGPTTFCTGGSVVLSAPAGLSAYLWSTGAMTRSITVTAPGSYSVTVTNSLGCSNTSALTAVTVNSSTPVTVIPAGPTTFCTGGSVTLNATAGFASYLWSNGATTSSIVVNTAGSYTVTATNGSGCNSTSTPIVVTVNPAPVLAITPSGPTTFCAGGTVTLNATPGFTGYLWSNGATTPSITVTGSGSYSVSATSGSCNVTSAATPVVVTPLPAATISASGPLTFCNGGSVVLSAPAGLAGYLWSNGSTSQGITVNTAGSYSVTVTDAAGCSALSAPAVVTVTPAPVTTITPSGPLSFCAGGSVTLTASAGVSYLWSNLATTQSITVTTPGTFAVTTTYGGGCSSTSANVVVSTTPAPPLTVTPGGPTTFCAGGNVTLTASSGFSSYLWSNGATAPAITVTAAGSYTVTASTPSCSITSAPTIVAIGAPTPATITAGGPTSFCSGGNVTLSANAGGTSYLWTNGATTPSITVSGSGSYGVTVTYSGGCTSVAAPVAVIVTPPPVVAIVAPASVAAGSNGNSASVLAGPAGTTYGWSISGGTILSGHGTPSITFSAGNVSNVSLTVTVTTAGCGGVATASIPVTGMTVPAKQADLGIAVSGPLSVAANGNVNYTILVTNAGPDPAVNVTLSDFNDNGAMTSLAGAAWNCSTSISGGLCSIASLPVGSSTLTASVTAPGAAGTIIDTASLSSPTSDPNAANNGASVTTAVTATTEACAGVPPSLIGPADGATNVGSPATFSWSAIAGASQYELWTANGGGSPSLAGTTPSTSLTLTLPGGDITWYVIADFAQGGCAPLVSAQRGFRVTGGTNCDTHGAASLVAPAPGATVQSPATFQWMPVPQAIGYRVWFAVGGGAPQDAGTTDGATQLTAAVPPGPIDWYVDALFNGCPATRSAASRFAAATVDACATHAPAVPTAPADKSSLGSSTVDFRWTASQGATAYRVWVIVDGGMPAVLGTTDGTLLKAPVSGGSVAWYVETLFDGCPSLFSAHLTFTIVRSLQCGTEVSSLISPAPGVSTPDPLVNFVWSQVPEASGYELWAGLNSGARVLMGSTPGSVTSLTKEAAAGDLEWFVRARFDGCTPRDSQHATFRVEPPAGCTGQRPLLTAPLENAAGEQSPVTFRWTSIPGASSYRLYIGTGGATPSLAATTNTTSAGNVTLPAGRVDWYVEATLGGGCPPVRSTIRRFTVVPATTGCNTPAAPSLIAPSEVSSNVRYAIQWPAVAGASSYLVQESSSAAFSGATSVATTSERVEFQHANDSAELTTFFYRVRASSSCANGQGANGQGAYSPVAGVGILPRSSGGAKSVSGALPLDAAQGVTYTIPLSASLAGQTFVATPNQPWITVVPPSGTVPAGGTTLTVLADTNGLPIGTSLGGVTLTFGAGSSAAGGPATNAAAPSSTTTISMSKVAPVTVNPKTAPPPDALIIPAVAHADGINSRFSSDVRITNTAPQVMKYQLTFTPSGDEGIRNGRQTQIEIDPGRTIAIDDILKSWFSTGTASATGVLEVRPLTQVAASTSSAALSGIPNIVTFASSRTFNTTGNGTFGQYIPAIPFANFIGKAAGAGNALSSILSLQQIAQSDAYRTNLGLVEGSGEPASLLVSVFGSGGAKLTEFPVELKGGQHLQLNSFMAERGLQVTDGRVEVKVTSPGGKVTAYASVLDNLTNDPLLVTPVTMSEAGSSKYVIAGVADLNNGLANWRTDVRVYNNSANTVDATLTFVSQNGGGPKAVPLPLAPGEVKQLDSVLASLFGATNDGGALHLSTPAATSLIATARTYNQTASGTYGQFISAVTPDGAIGAGSRPLQLLQVEESDRYRSNIGVAEVSGKPATIEVTALPPDSKVAAVLRFDLAPNQFIQYNQLLRSLSMENTYNARISVKVTAGAGRVTAYASVIDSQTQDPTYIPAQ